MEIFEKMSLEERKAAIEKLLPFIGEERVQKMRSVLQNRTRHFCLLFEDVFQKHNISAILRSCEAFGIQDVYVSQNKYKYEIASQIVMGADKWLNIDVQKREIDQTYASLRQKGYKIAAACFTPNSIPIEKIDPREKLVLVFGTEKTGLSQKAIECADIHYHIPMYGFTQSFNVSVAAALSMQFLRQKLSGLCPEKLPLAEDEKEVLLLSWLVLSIKMGRQIIGI